MTTPFPEIGTTLDCYAGVDYVPTIHDCIRHAAVVCEIPVSDILGRSKCRAPTRARQIAMWAARKVSEKNFVQIARAFNRDHSTAMHAYRCIQNIHDKKYGPCRTMAREVFKRLNRPREADPLENWE
jgi:chromosomal replication initiation ATPase DnaA